VSVLLVLPDTDVILDAHLLPSSPRGAWMRALISSPAATLIVPDARRQVFVRTSARKAGRALHLLSANAGLIPTTAASAFLSSAPSASWVNDLGPWITALTPVIKKRLPSTAAPFSPWLVLNEAGLVADLQAEIMATLSGGNVSISTGFRPAALAETLQFDRDFSAFFAGRSARGVPDATDLPIFTQMLVAAKRAGDRVSIVTGDRRFFENMTRAVASPQGTALSLKALDIYCFATLFVPPHSSSMSAFAGPLSADLKPRRL